MKLAEAVLREVVDFKVEEDRFQVRHYTSSSKLHSMCLGNVCVSLSSSAVITVCDSRSALSPRCSSVSTPKELPSLAATSILPNE